MDDSKQSLANQFRWSCAVIDCINDIISALKRTDENYRSLIEFLGSTSLVRESLAILAKQREEFSEGILPIIDHLNKVHIDYVERQKQEIKRRMMELGDS